MPYLWTGVEVSGPVFVLSGLIPSLVSQLLFTTFGSAALNHHIFPTAVMGEVFQALIGAVLKEVTFLSTFVAVVWFR